MQSSGVDLARRIVLLLNREKKPPPLSAFFLPFFDFFDFFLPLPLLRIDSSISRCCMRWFASISWTVCV